MDLLAARVRSLLVLIAFISDNVLLFDWWIITPPGSPPAPRGRSKLSWRDRAVAVLKTACTYAILEPLCFWLVNGGSLEWVTTSAMLGAFCHHIAFDSTNDIFMESLEGDLQRHVQFCRPTAATAISADTAYDLRDSEKAHLMSQEIARPALPDGANDGNASARCTCRRGSKRLVKLAVLLPVVTATATNTGFSQYTAYLHSDECDKWFERFTSGWLILTLCVLVLFVLSKWGNRSASTILNRHVSVMDQHWTLDLAMRASAWVILMAIRSACRSIQARPVFTAVSWGKGGLALPQTALRGYDLPWSLETTLKFGEESAWWMRYLPYVSVVASLGSGVLTFIRLREARARARRIETLAKQSVA